MMKAMVLLLAALTHNAMSDCEEKCDKYIKATLICASNGKTYMDLCRAHCFDESLTQLFECETPDEPKKCERECERTFLSPGRSIKKCEAACPAVGEGSLVCASDGITYPSLCHATCINTTLTQVFECNQPVDIVACANDCMQAVLEPPNCLYPCAPPPEERLYCVSDGTLTSNTCNFFCLNPTLTALFDCPTPFDYPACEQSCKEAAAKNCEEECPVDLNGRSFCASNGEVYTDFCRAHCVDKTLTKLFECPPSNESENCLKICKKKTAQKKCESKCMDGRGINCRCAPKEKKEECCTKSCSGVKVPFPHRCIFSPVGSTLEPSA